MSFDYTTNARRFWAKQPLLAYLSIQIGFWIAANIFLAVILTLRAMQIHEMLQLHQLSELKPTLLIAVIFGTGYATIVGLLTYHLERSFYRGKSLGLILLTNTIISFLVLILLMVIVRMFIVDVFLSAYVRRYPLNNKSWEYFFLIVVVFYFFMTLLINFINEVNKKYGPGVLVPLLFGKYRQPREEERIFMFMDLQSSTSHAERLGHLKYSSFIRDSFEDINNIVSAYDAEIYQYVGDEIVLCWRLNHGIYKASCIRLFFACKMEFSKRASYYKQTYGILPVFKAGIHGGKITVVEIGNIKKDIAYHGDVLNTSARIQGLCNQYGYPLIISTSLLKMIDLPEQLREHPLGSLQLIGREERIELSGILEEH